jgi:hypothetical protein
MRLRSALARISAAVLAQAIVSGCARIIAWTASNCFIASA